MAAEHFGLLRAALLNEKEGVCETMQFENGKNQNNLRVEDIDKIYNTYHNWEAIEKYSYIATKEEIAENDYNLNIPRYVDTFEEEEPIDIAATQQEIATIKTDMTAVEQQMAAYLKELGY